MAAPPKLDKATFTASANACLSNGMRLLNEAELLEYEEPPSTSFALATLAQEEFAKGFLLLLVSRDVVPWNALIYRATRDHTCKQLLGVVMSYMNPDTDEFDRRMDEWRIKHEEHARLLKQYKDAENAAERDKVWERIQELNASQDLLPRTVADAINILRHEKIGRWQSSNWFWDEEPVYDEIAKRLADGHLDREKQDCLYVRLGKDGRVVRLPKDMKPENAKQAREDAKRLGQLVEMFLSGDAGPNLDHEKVEAAFKAVFANLEKGTQPDPEAG